MTGDRVVLVRSRTGDADVSVEPAAGRRGIQFLVERRAGQLHVLPSDALPLLASGRLDERLFNVTALVEAGYDDARRSSVPLIVKGHSGMARIKAASGLRVTHDLPAIDGVGADAVKSESSAGWLTIQAELGAGQSRTATAGGLSRVWLDGVRKPSLDRSTAQINAPAAWSTGLTGRGVTIAVLDTGVDSTHPDLAGRIAEERDFTGGSSADDEVGHGTHVASTIAGTGAASGGRFRGVAPDATIVAGKVCGGLECTESAILAGMQWAAAERRVPVVNMSLGGPDSPGTDPLEEAVGTLTDRYGTLFVVAAGNEGNSGAVSSPASADAALAVGAVDREGRLADFSNAGPRQGDLAVKPDITAPGVDIVAARARHGRIGTPTDQYYTAMSGTSMATPHVAGAAALLRQRHPDWTAATLKGNLMAAARPNPTLSVFQQGSGLVDAGAAIAQMVTAQPASLSLGEQRWPHSDDVPVIRTITYRNIGANPLRLDLSVRGTGPGGVTAPAGMFRLDRTRLDLMPADSATVRLTVDTRVGSTDGKWSASLIASGGPSPLTVPIGLVKEPESYDLTLRHIDRTGAPATTYETGVASREQNEVVRAYDADGTATVRLPKGPYLLFSGIATDYGPERTHSAFFSQPILDLGRDTEITLDARRAKQFRLSVSDAHAELVALKVAVRQETAAGPYSVAMLAFSTADIATTHLGSAAPGGHYTSTVTHLWAEPASDGLYRDSPYLYTLSEGTRGRLIDNLTRRYRPRDLALVHNVLHAGPAGAEVNHSVQPIRWGRAEVMLAVPMSNPGSRIDYVNQDTGLRWASDLYFTGGSLGEYGAYQLSEASRRFSAGQRVRVDWNGTPTGPAFPQKADTTDPWVIRTGDYLGGDLPLFSDAAGHAGTWWGSTGTVRLYRDGTLVGQLPGASAFFDLSPQPARYRLEAGGPLPGSPLGTTVSAAWSFSSQHVPEDDRKAVPLAAVRFGPPTRNHDNGRGDVIPVTLQWQPGVSAPKLHKIHIESSTDDGKTWEPATVRPTRHGWLAVASVPSGKTVSLRASISASQEVTLTQTVLRAYRS
ncbi:S8 family serine peptidase [Micromonospora chokoriensis]